MINERTQSQLKKQIEDQHALRRASQNYVESIEDRVYRIEQKIPDVQNTGTLIAKGEWTHAKVKDIEQELFRLKRALANKGVLKTDE